MDGHHHLRPVVSVLAAVALLALGAAGYPTYPFTVCGSSSLYKANSTYQAQLDVAAATVPRNASTSPDLFATAVVGAVPEQLWAMGLCRGDINATTCFACLTQAFNDLPNFCSYQKDASIYYDACILHYSDIHVLASDDDGPQFDASYIYSLVNVTSDPARYSSLLAALVNATADYAAYNSTRRFATGEADFDLQPHKVYAVAQCTPDQPPAQCRKCLARLITEALPAVHAGARTLWFNCTFRYETSPFYNGPAMVRLASRAPAPAPAPALQPTVGTPALAGGGERKLSVPVVVPAILLPVVAALNLVVCFCFWGRRRSAAQAKQQPHPRFSTETEDIEMVDSMLIDVSTLRAATANFAESNKLGQGGFGTVYKGVLPNGDEIAVKRLSQSSTQGVEELKNELALVAKLKHKNLARLVGVCLEQQERLLVYEFVPNRSLDLILFDIEKREQLDWEQRYKIINGIARGLQYLHEDSQLKVVHRDLKASNILLDANMNPKISDFGLARIFGRDQTQAVTKRVVGTYGYMAPEYVTRGNYSVKSDAFCFGVIVLEIITGRKNSGCSNSGSPEDLLTMVWEHWEAGTATETVDPCMGGSFSEGDLLKCIHVGLLCVQGDPAVRPVMSSVVTMLGSDTVNFQEDQAPSKPAFLSGNTADDQDLVDGGV
ncbi:unnamed protein product [Urochloa decumbens]|uniref:Uncharacterized protein n=1 Tax=Urochloa decumbens TaxID=240449 RepID=A0ABC9ESX4_9POAL